MTDLLFDWFGLTIVNSTKAKQIKQKVRDTVTLFDVSVL